MGTVTHRKSGTQHRPLTFADVARHIARNPSPCLVQVRVKGAVLCARVIELGSATSEREFFRVHSALGEQWVPAANARMCSGDGRCCCEGGGVEAAERSGAGTAQPSALPPLGNTGVTTVGAA